MATQAMNPAYLLDPSLYGDQQANAQQQQLATLLMQQGLTPMEGTQMAGQVALRNSGTQSLAKLAALLSGQSIQGQVNQSNQALMQRQSQAVMPMFQDQTSGLPPQQAALAAGGQGPTNSAAAAAGSMPGQTTRPGPWTLPGSTGQASLSAYLLNPEEYGKTFASAQAPTEATKTATQGGFDPRQANRDAFAKANTDGTVLRMRQAGMSEDQINAAIYGEAAKAAEFDRKPGNFYSNPVTKESGIVPFIPHNANIVGRPAANGAVAGVAPIPGAPGVIASTSAATTAGTNSQTPETGYVNGQPVNTTRAARVTAAQQSQRDSDALPILQNEYAQATDPATKAAIGREIATRFPKAAVSPEQAPGVVAGANNAQKTLGDRFDSLRDTVATAQTTNSYLDNIKQLSTSAATGKFSDRLDFANAILAPFNEKANDAKTANDLLNKYSNQIVSRLSTGGLGTDAARTILGSAYPNAHMTKDAIAEAVDNIKGVNQMQSAKLSYLSEAGNKRDTAGYQQREQQFDQIADPRVFQLAHMTAEQAGPFLAKMPPAVRADLVKRAQALKQMGAL